MTYASRFEGPLRLAKALTSRLALTNDKAGGMFPPASRMEQLSMLKRHSTSR